MTLLLSLERARERMTKRARSFALAGLALLVVASVGSAIAASGAQALARPDATAALATTVRTTLDATDLWTSSHVSRAWNVTGCAWSTGKLGGRLGPGDDGALVGNDNHYAESTFLWTCWEKADWAYRARPVFDLDELGDKVAGITKAVLTWHERNWLWRNADGINPDDEDPIRCAQDVLKGCGGDPHYCSTRLGVATTAPGTTKGLTPRTSTGGIHGPKRYIVTDAVKRWLNGNRPNYGFVLGGADETYQRDNAACISVLSDFQLEVTYTTS